MFTSIVLAFTAQFSQTSPFLELPAAPAPSEVVVESSQANAAILQLSSAGTCPGPMDFRINGGAPGNTCRLIYATGPGAFVIPSGPCVGTVTGLNATATLYAGVDFFSTTGTAMFLAIPVPAAACGYSVQAIEVETCMLSNVIVL